MSRSGIRTVRPARVRLADVAAAAGVSIGAASMALSGTAETCPLHHETRRRITEVAAALGYQADWRGRALARQRTDTVGLIVAQDFVHASPVFMSMMTAMTRTLAAHQLELLVIAALPGESAWKDRLRQGRVDGCVAITPSPPDLAEATRGIPLVLLNELRDIACIQVNADERAAGALAARSLIEAGHRRIGFAAPEPRPGAHYSEAERWEGCVEAMSEQGLKPLRMSQSPADLALMAACGSGPTAMVFYEAFAARTFLHHCWRLHVDVPRQISVVAFNDEIDNTIAVPPLSSIRVPIYAMTTQAIELLIETMAGAKPNRSRHIRVACALDARASIGPPRGG